jgi:hypothetical protein
VSVTAPPRTPRSPQGAEQHERKEIEALVEALIEEARQRARRRRQKYWGIAALVTLVGLGIITVFGGGGAASKTPPPPSMIRSAGAGEGRISKIAFIRYAGKKQDLFTRYELVVMNSDAPEREH